MATNDSRNILIAGGGIGGLSLAGFLQQRGIAFELVERTPAWAPVGAGIALAFNPMRLLHELGVGDAVTESGFTFSRGVISDHHAKPKKSETAAKTSSQEAVRSEQPDAAGKNGQVQRLAHHLKF